MRNIKICLAFLALSCGSAHATLSDVDNDGYLEIYTPQDLREAVGSNSCTGPCLGFELENDIDFGQVGTTPEGSYTANKPLLSCSEDTPNLPLGDLKHNLNGNGNYIKGFCVYNGEGDLALFNKIGSDQGIVLHDVRFVGHIRTTGNAALIALEAENVAYRHYARLEGSAESTTANVGGLFFHARNIAIDSGKWFINYIQTTGPLEVGGFFHTVEDSTVGGISNVRMPKGTKAVGGIAAYAWNTILDKPFAYGGDTGNPGGRLLGIADADTQITSPELPGTSSLPVIGLITNRPASLATSVKLSASSVSEGQNLNLELSLNGAPASPITFDIAAEGFAIETPTLTIDANNWESTRLIPLQAIDDQIIKGTITTQVTVTPDATGIELGLSSSSHDIEVRENDQLALHGLAHLPNLNEGESSTLRLSLSHEVQSDVPVAVTFSEVTASPSSFSFNSENWQSGVEISLLAEQNTAFDGPKTATLEVSSTNADPVFGFESQSQSFDIIDDETNELSLSLAPSIEESTTEPLSFGAKFPPARDQVFTIEGQGLMASPKSVTLSPNNWKNVTVSILALDDKVVNVDMTRSINVVPSAQSAADGYQAIHAETTVIDNDSLVLDFSNPMVLTEGQSTAVQFSLKTAPPKAISVSLPTSDSISFDPQTLVFDQNNWQSGLIVSVTAVEDEVASAARQVDLNITPTAAASEIGLLEATLRATIKDNDVLRLISPENLKLKEGERQTMSLSLSHEPASPVSFDLSGDEQLLVEQSRLTFNAENWQSGLSVDLVPTDDAIAESSHRAEINMVASSSAKALGLTDSTLSLPIEDNDTLALVYSEKLDIDEGETASFALKLNTQPAQAISIDLAAEGAVLGTDSLSLDASNWQSGVSTSLTRPDNAIADGQSEAVLRLTPDQQGLDLGLSETQSTLRYHDDDVLAIQTTAAEQVTEGTALQAQVSLNMAPARPIEIAIEAPTSLSLSSAVLTFNDSNWAQPQSLSITSTDNEIAGDTQQVELKLGTQSAGYEALSQSVALTIVDDETQALLVDAAPDLSEGQSVEQTIRLQKEPATPVTVSLSGQGVDLSPNQITLDAQNWQSGVAYSVVAASNDTVDAPRPYALKFEASGAAPEQQTEATISDNQTLDISLQSDDRVNEASSISLYFGASAKPSKPVSVQLTAPAPLTLSADTLTIDSSNWKSASVTLSVAEDDNINVDLTREISWLLSSELPLTKSQGTKTLSIVDNDTQALSGLVARQLVEGQTETLMIALEKAPESVYQVDFSAEGLRLNPSTLRFDSSNYQNAQPLKISVQSSDYLIGDRQLDTAIQARVGDTLIAEQSYTASASNTLAHLPQSLGAVPMLHAPSAVEYRLFDGATIAPLQARATSLPSGLDLVDGQLIGTLSAASAGAHQARITLFDAHGTLRDYDLPLTVHYAEDKSLAALAQTFEAPNALALEQALDQYISQQIDRSYDSTPLSDYDGDGTPDWYEIAMGMDFTSRDVAGIVSVPQAIVVLPDETLNPQKLGLESSEVEVQWQAIHAKGDCELSLPADFAERCTLWHFDNAAHGTSSLWWLATNAKGHWLRTADSQVPKQTLTVLPELRMDRDSALTEGSQLRATLSAPATVDIEVPLIKSGPLADSVSSAQNQLIIAAGQTQSAAVPVKMDGSGTDGWVQFEIVKSQASAIELGYLVADDATRFDFTSDITELPSVTAAWIAQQDQPVTDIDPSAAVMLKLTTSHRWPAGVHVDWSKSDAGLRTIDGKQLHYADSLAPTLQLDNVQPGVYSAVLRVSSARSSAHRQIEWTLRVNDPTTDDGQALASRVDSDSDGDGTVDSEELNYDHDMDGVPNWLDPQNNLANDLPLGSHQTRISTDPAYRLEVGYQARRNRSDSVLVSPSTWIFSDASDATLDRDIVGAYDFILRGLAMEDESTAKQNGAVTLGVPDLQTRDIRVIDLKSGAPLDPAFISWSAPVAGGCPAVTSPLYSPATIDGASCVRVVLQDGGVHDQDGITDGVIMAQLALDVDAGAKSSVITNTNSAASGGALGLMSLLLATVLAVFSLRHQRHKD